MGTYRLEAESQGMRKAPEEFFEEIQNSFLILHPEVEF